MESAQVDNPTPHQPKDALPPFAWPERYAPFAEGYTGDGLRIETPEEIATRIKGIQGTPIPPNQFAGERDMGNNELVHNAQTRVFAFDGQNRVATLWYARQEETGLTPRPMENHPLLKSPDGKTLRVEYVYDDDGKVAAKRIIKDSTPGAYDGEVYAIETYDYDEPRDERYRYQFLGTQIADEPGFGIGRLVHVLHRDMDKEWRTQDYTTIAKRWVEERGGKIDAHLWEDRYVQYGGGTHNDNTLIRGAMQIYVRPVTTATPQQ